MKIFIMAMDIEKRIELMMGLSPGVLFLHPDANTTEIDLPLIPGRTIRVITSRFVDRESAYLFELRPP